MIFLKLKKDWRNYWRGSVIKVDDKEAALLVQRKIAVYSPQDYMTKSDLDFALKRR